MKFDLPLEKFSGLYPEAWLCLDKDFSKEEIKNLILRQDKNESQGLLSTVILDVNLLCKWIIESSGEPIPRENILGSLSRQEVLKMLLSERRILTQLKEIKRLRRQRGFYKKLDRAIQAGRNSFSHNDEERVMSERLNELLGTNTVREDVRALAITYEAWMNANNYYDPAMLLQKAHAVLDSGAKHFNWPKEIYFLRSQKLESLCATFWEKIKSYAKLNMLGIDNTSFIAAQTPQINWDKWHTLDDATESLAETLSEHAKKNGIESLKDHVVLIPDLPKIRRSFRRSLQSWGLYLLDPRNPAALKEEENIKWGLIPLDVVASRFEREKVVSWIRNRYPDRQNEWVRDIYARGIYRGLGAYSGGKLAELYDKLSNLYDKLGGKQNIKSLSEAHIKILESETAFQKKEWAIKVFRKLWQDTIKDRERVFNLEKKASLLFWLDGLKIRLEQAEFPQIKKPKNGVVVYRLNQIISTSVKHLWVLGLPPEWFSMSQNGDYWWNNREREILASEFQVRSEHQIIEEKKWAFSSWCYNCEQIVFLDSYYDPDGKERESLLPVLRELGFIDLQVAEEKGAHFRFLPGMNPIVNIQNQEIKLSTQNTSEVYASDLDLYSRCPFLALTYTHWQLRDLKEPDIELWGNVRGTLLHKSVEILVGSRNKDGEFSKSPQEALQEAWLLKPPMGMISRPKIEAYLKQKLIKVLEIFCEEESKYAKRSCTSVMSIEDMHLQINLDGVNVQGRPDRVDKHPEGLFVIDYKTSDPKTKGIEMVELGDSLQLPFYAIAIEEELKTPVLGTQFIQLNSKGSRSQGIFFMDYNGKETGKLTKTTKTNKSLLAIQPEEAWKKCKVHIQEHVKKFTNGEFSPRPKKEDRCKGCAIKDLCGKRRIEARSGENDE